MNKKPLQELMPMMSKSDTGCGIMKVIHWINIETKETGHGEPVPDHLADVWVEEWNKEYPLIKHRAEQVR